MLSGKRFYSTSNYNPNKIYPNMKKQKFEILAENKAKSGIYLLINLINDKISEAHKGKIFSEETKKKLSVSSKGNSGGVQPTSP